MEKTFPYEKIKRDVLIRRIGNTNIKFGKDVEQRTVEELIHSGIINLNKGKGPTSHMHEAYLKEIFSIPKAGHSGTLVI